MTRAAVLACFALLFLGCEAVHTPGILARPGGQSENPQAGDGGENGEIPKAPTLSFAFLAERVIGNGLSNPGRCLRCHQPGGSADLYPMTNFAEVKSLAADIIATSVMGQSMPPVRAPQLLACQKRLLSAWVEAGTPEFGTVEVPEELQDCR